MEIRELEIILWPVRLAGPGRQVLILEIRGSNPLRAAILRQAQDFYMWYVYILQSDTNYYIGITENLDTRIKHHQAGYGADYTKRFNTFKLVYSETYSTCLEAEKREKQLKGWNKGKKQALINQDFPLLKKLSKNSGLVEG